MAKNTAPSITRHSPLRTIQIGLPIVLACLHLVLLLLSLSPTAAQSPLIRLTTGGNAFPVAWSPNGDTLLIRQPGTIVANGHLQLSELWSASIATHKLHRLSANAFLPAYSPDGSQIAYLSYIPSDHTWNLRRLDLRTGLEESIQNLPWGQTPAWKPDGTLTLRPIFQQINNLLGRIVPAPDNHTLALLTPGPDPALWIIRPDSPPQLLLQGHLEAFSLPTWTPDSQTLLLSRAPLGTSTASQSDLWIVPLEGTPTPLATTPYEESAPLLSPDGRHLAFTRDGDVWLLDLSSPSAAESLRMDYVTPSLASIPSPPPLQAQAQQTPPDTIRVIHSAYNTCRNVPVGQIDTLPFEEYVRRVTPYEVPPSWPMEALKAQAVAARTYGWYHVLQGKPDYDVTDWIDYQYMCDNTFTHTNAAAAATEGQYIAYNGNVIISLFSAENSHPTLTYDDTRTNQVRQNSNTPIVGYLVGIRDPVGFGKTQYGHGWGMSQNGIYRWTTWHGWSYQQMLTHYYSGTTVELPAGDGTADPIGAITSPWSDHFVTSNRIAITANASDDANALTAVGFYARITDTFTLITTDTLSNDGWNTLWDITSLSDTITPSIVLSLTLTDAHGNVQREVETATIGLDRTPPTGTATLLAVDEQTRAITFSISATDPSPGSGVDGIAVSGEGWQWEETGPGVGYRFFWNVGARESDPQAYNGQAWHANPTDGRGIVYGPYTTILPQGQSYIAWFRLKIPTTALSSTAEIAKLDVVDTAGLRTLGLYRLRGIDFRNGDTYQEFGVPFAYTPPYSNSLEFRLHYFAQAEIWLDRILVTTYPTSTTPLTWTLDPGEGPHTLTLKVVDRAGNPSQDILLTPALTDTTPPGGWHDFGPSSWAGGSPPLCHVRVSDSVSGLDVDSAAFQYSTDGGQTWSSWQTALCSGTDGTAAIETISATVPFPSPAPTNQVRFRIADLKGQIGYSPVYTVTGSTTYLPLILRTVP